MKRKANYLAWTALAVALVASSSGSAQMRVPPNRTGDPSNDYSYTDTRDPTDTTYPHAHSVPTPLFIGGLTAPLATGRSVAIGQWGSYCATQVKTCELNHASFIGSGCSCRVPGGRAQGSVVP
jgi:hypothetical protein